MISTNTTPADDLTADQLADLTAVKLLTRWAEIDHEYDQHTEAIPLGQLLTAPRVFCSRDPEEDAYGQRTIVRALAKAVRQREPYAPLEALTVLPFGPLGHIVIDGHMRLAAYRRAGLTEDDRIPVEVFTGTLPDALARAAATNSKNRLPLTLAEKQEYAWRMVTMNDSAHCYTHAGIARDAGISRQTVINMKKELTEAKAEAQSTGDDPLAMTLKELRRWRRQLGDDEPETLDRYAEQVAAMAARIGNALGDLPRRNPEMFADAVAKFMGTRTPRVAYDLIHHIERGDLTEYLQECFGVDVELPEDEF